MTMISADRLPYMLLKFGKNVKYSEKKVRKQRPRDSYDKSSRNLALERCFTVRKVTVQHQKYKKQYYKYKKSLGTQYPSKDFPPETAYESQAPHGSGFP